MTLKTLAGLAIFTTAVLTASRATAQTAATPDSAPPPNLAIFKYVDQMPRFQGNLSEFLSSSLRYPDSARARNQEGRAVVEFTVNTTGLAENIHVVRSSGFALLDEEAVRALQPMATTVYWTPGKADGKAVRVYYTLPITFKLSN